MFIVLQATTQTFEIEGSSMQPTLIDGQRVLVNRFVYARSSIGPFGDGGYVFHGPQRGDIIIFHPPTGDRNDFVKRVIGLPGDEVDIRNGQVFVNGDHVDYVDDYTQERTYEYPQTVPEGELFVLGDNRRVSNDSRSWGFVPREDVVGRAWVVYWPFGNFRLFS
jgi:signal peptidase I